MYSGWCWVDVDGTLIDANDKPRPYIKELFEGIKGLNLILVVWSGGGREYAEMKTRRLGDQIYNLVDIFHWKGTPVNFNSIAPTFFIDDAKFLIEEHKKDGSDGYLLPFYHQDTMQGDNHLLKALKQLQAFMSQYNKGGERKINIDFSPNESYIDWAKENAWP